MEYLKRILIKDYKNTDDSGVRSKYGVVAGALGIFSNLVLFAIKLIVGLIGHSMTIIADAVNNLTDALTSIVTIIGFRLAARPADKEHRYGHQRYEYITVFIVAFLILIVGVMLGKSSVEKIITPTKITINYLTYIVLSVAILIKLWQMLLYQNFAKSIDSGALRANAIDSRNDIVATFFVIVAAIIMDLTSINLDGYFGVAISVAIAVSAIKLIKENISPLLGGTADDKISAEIEKIILSYDGVLGVHDLMLHHYGADKCYAVIDIEVSAGMELLECHHLMDTIERDVKSKLGVHLTTHMDPIELDNEFINTLQNIVEQSLNSFDKRLGMHDFRAIKRKDYTKVYFDMEVPFEMEVDMGEIEKFVLDALKSHKAGNYLIIMELDRH